jgi:hypothetical protein
MAGNKKPSWKELKSVLIKKEKSELLKLVSDLYSLSTENRSFLHSKYSLGEQSLEPYRKIISESLYPDVYKNKPIKLSMGRKAISDYFKATKDHLGQLELMVHYLETGNQFTVDFGDIDEKFYSSLESMFGRIISSLRNQSKDVHAIYHPRLENVVASARNIGWGYYDYISDIFGEYEIETNST